MLSPKRAGLLLVGLVVLILLLEGGLSLFRTRRVTVGLAASGPTAIPSLTPNATATPDGTPAEPEPPAVTVISAKGAPVVTVNIDYRIGPRFPATNIYVEALNSSGNPVAASAARFECGADALQCAGQVSVTLRYAVIEPSAVQRLTPTIAAPTMQPQDWQIGRYTARVTRSYAGLDSAIVAEVPFLVAE